MVGEGLKHPAWKLTCSTCEGIKVITMADRNLPPDAIIKKFVQAGWFIGKRPEYDQCAECLNKKKERKHLEKNADIVEVLNQHPDWSNRRIANEVNAKNAATIFQATDAAAVSRERSFICGIHALLIDGLVDDAISRIESHLPSWPLQKRKESPKVINQRQIEKTEAEFSEWIKELEKKHQTGDNT